MLLTLDKQVTFALLQRLATAICKLFGPQCEVVIHDFADFEHSIVHIEGNVSNRSVGGAATDLLLARARSGETDEDLYSYLTSLQGGGFMKSSTIFLRDEGGEAYGAFCINFNISGLMSFRNLLSDMIATEERDSVTELLSDDIASTVGAMITEAIYDLDKELPILSREDKIDLIAQLDARGVFQVKKAVPLVADQLGLSRATVYNYLAEARNHNHNNHQGGE